MISDRIKQAISRVLPWRISRGISVSTDDTLVLTKLPDNKQLEKASSSASYSYQLKSNTDEFELVGIIKKGKMSQYQLRHLLTGDTINLSKNILDLLFEKSPRKKSSK